ncbi:c-type cytochrome [Nibricoccus sp. IMCC34717]|uniref:c-type cytochrome n=1 Tax=Nibricoccus sp. IMCC34717 TaxID=3034021 RepID=UPI00384F78D5
MKPRLAPKLLCALFVFVGSSVFAATAAENWENHCAKCHGTDGKAQTKIGRKLSIKDYTDPAVQAKMSDEEILKGIREGYRDEKGKERMKAYKDELSDQEIKDLLTYIRKLKA